MYDDCCSGLSNLSIPDLRFYRTYHDSLNRNHPSTLSIRKALTERFQSRVESTHGPPSMSPALSFPALKLDYSWTILDRAIVSLVSPSWLLEYILVGGAGHGARLLIGNSCSYCSCSNDDKISFGPHLTDTTAAYRL